MDPSRLVGTTKETNLMLLKQWKLNQTDVYRVGSVSVHITKLEPQRNGGGFTQQDGKKASVNQVLLESEVIKYSYK